MTANSLQDRNYPTQSSSPRNAEGEEEDITANRQDRNDAIQSSPPPNSENKEEEGMRAYSLQNNYNPTQSGSLSDSESEDEEEMMAYSLQNSYSPTQSGSPPDSESEEEEEIIAHGLQNNYDPTHSGSPLDTETDERLARDVHEKIIRGLEYLRKLKEKSKPQPLGISISGGNAQSYGSLRELLVQRAPQLLRQAHNVLVLGRSQSWFLNFLAGTIYLYYRLRSASENDSIPELDEHAQKTLRSWATNVRLVIRIVRGLHSTWGDKTYLIYYALACMSPIFNYYKNWI